MHAVNVMYILPCSTGVILKGWNMIKGNHEKINLISIDILKKMFWWNNHYLHITSPFRIPTQNPLNGGECCIFNLKKRWSWTLKRVSSEIRHVYLHVLSPITFLYSEQLFDACKDEKYTILSKPCFDTVYLK
jgi:hypothetical protein